MSIGKIVPSEKRTIPAKLESSILVSVIWDTLKTWRKHIALKRFSFSWIECGKMADLVFAWQTCRERYMMVIENRTTAQIIYAYFASFIKVSKHFVLTLTECTRLACKYFFLYFCSSILAKYASKTITYTKNFHRFLLRLKSVAWS